MTYTEEYREYMAYTFHAHCRIVLYHAPVDAAGQRHRRDEKSPPCIPDKRKTVSTKYL